MKTGDVHVSVSVSVIVLFSDSPDISVAVLFYPGGDGPSA